MKKYWPLVIVFIISILSVCLYLYKLTGSPPCLNADEVVNAYDAFSVLSTGKDQYGTSFPLRFKSFGDYKLPLLTYVAIPFIKTFGLSNIGIRLVNLPFVFLFPFLVYFLALELFNKKSIGYIAAILAAFAPGIQLLGRQAHEGYMTVFFLSALMLFFIRLLQKQSVKNYLLFFTTLLISLFGYHFSRLWAVFYLLIFIFHIMKGKLKKISLLFFILVLLAFGITDITNSPTRIQNLLFFKNQGFLLKLKEFQNEGGSKYVYNELSVAARDLTFEYLKYFSPQFLTISGDESANFRFGFPGVSPITPIEYGLFFIGLYFLFKNKEKWRIFILASLFIAPLTGSLSWAGLSITRSAFIFIPIILITAYGTEKILKSSKYFSLPVIGLYLFFLFFSWDIYLNHYPKRALSVRSWQCGYKELTDYVKENYSKFDKFYITRKNGQPYIFFLFYLKYPPEEYQKQAALTPPDEYGFGQIIEFDKFYFELPPTKNPKRSAIIGYPDDFSEEEKPFLKEIKIGTETIFLIKEIK